ncbi:MAG: hypothetical protein LIO79_00415 [Rikenellaceae bacterium]|nr:hypothetical protein [Rikenellaceae bacterium]
MKQLYRFFLFISLILIAGCTKDNLITDDITSSEDEIEVTLSAIVPSTSMDTKTLDKIDENRMADVDVLMFLVDGGQEVFAYRTHNTNDIDPSQDIQYVKASLKLSEESNEAYRIVLLANLREEIDEVMTNNSCEGMAKEALLELITFEHDSRWPANNDLGYRPLPMWGESKNTAVVTRSTTPSSFGGAINMLRSVARIQVGVSITQEDGYISDGTDFFELAEVKVYNARKTGYAVPLPANLDQEGKAEYPTILTGSEIIDAESMRYILKDIDINHNNQLTNNIYVNEALNEDADMSEALFLILKGYYTEEGEAKNTTEATYYRVDFYDKETVNGEDVRKNILRNFTYNITITGINGPGYDDEETAVNSIPLNMETSITDWSEGELKYVVFNGQYYLSVSESTMSLSKPAGTHSFNVKTNYPSGWTAVVSEGDEWLGGLTPDFSTNLEVIEPLAFTVTENDDSDRTGKISISAGTVLTLDVIINQSADEAMEIRLWDIQGQQFMDDGTE